MTQCYATTTGTLYGPPTQFVYSPNGTYTVIGQNSGVIGYECASQSAITMIDPATNEKKDVGVANKIELSVQLPPPPPPDPAWIWNNVMPCAISFFIVLAALALFAGVIGRDRRTTVNHYHEHSDAGE